MNTMSQKVALRHLGKQAAYRSPEAWVRVDEDAIFMSVEVPAPPMDWADKFPVYLKEALGVCREGAEALQRVFGGEAKFPHRLYYIAKEGGQFAFMTDAPVSVGTFGVALPGFSQRTPAVSREITQKIHNALGWRVRNVEIIR